MLSLHADARSPEHGQYGFLQDLVRRVAYETLAKQQRKQLHLAAADFLGPSGAEDELAEVIAAHSSPPSKPRPRPPTRRSSRFARAGALLLRRRARGVARRRRGGEAVLRAGREARRRERTRARLIARAGEMAYSASQPREAEALLEEARAPSPTSAMSGRPHACSSLLATMDFEDGHPPQAVARLEPVIADLDTGEPDAVLAEIAGQLGRFLIFTGETERAAPTWSVRSRSPSCSISRRRSFRR